ncbi:MAG: transcription termination/antitermination protein NusG [Thermodesulfobacteriota bacterium]
MSKAWYIVYTKPKKEPIVEIKLGQKMIPVFCPMTQETGWRKGRVVFRPKPFFPGYLFVHISIESDYYMVKWTHGVKRFIGCGDLPLHVDDRIIDFLKSRIDERGFVRKDKLNKGDRVKVKSGPFNGLMGIIENDVPASGRVKVLMDLVRYQGTIELPEVLLEGLS